VKVTVTKNLNVRVGKPSLNAPCYQYIAPGSELEVDGKLYTGDKYNGNDQWYKDEAGNYYWSGGVEAPDEFTVTNTLNTIKETSFDWWHREFQIQKVWELLDNKGEGVNVVILDSGIDYNHPYFTCKISGESVVGDKNDYLDNWNHGTLVSSIIAANGDDLIGIAPLINLHAIKIFDKYGCREEDFLTGISLIPDDADLVCIAQSKGYLDNQNLSQKYIDAFKKIKTKLIICSAGNDTNRSVFSEELPAALSDTISVSSVKSGGLISDISSMSKNITLAGPGENVKCLAAGEKMRYYRGPQSGTSFSTPFITGVMALAIAYLKKNKKKISEKRLKQLLIDTCTKKTDSNLYGNGVIDPLEFAKKIISE